MTKALPQLIGNILSNSLGFPSGFKEEGLSPSLFHGYAVKVLASDRKQEFRSWIMTMGVI